MAPPQLRRLIFPALLCCILAIIPAVKPDDEEDTVLSLFQGINNYRSSLNLSSLTMNDNAECLASELADQFKKQPCTNSTGSFTVPGMETQIPSYPDLLKECHLNVSNTRDGSVMPVCVPNLVPDLVLSNYTKSQYSESLNDTKYTGIGIGSEDNWIVVILTTNTTEGSYSPASSDKDDSMSFRTASSSIFRLMFLLIGGSLLLL